MVQINVGSGQGITQAIKSKIENDGGQIKNSNLSVWQQVLTEVKTAQNNGAQIYTGGDDVENLNNRSNWKTDFKVVAGQVIELAQNVWDKIVQLLTGTALEISTQNDDAQNNLVNQQNTVQRKVDSGENNANVIEQYSDEQEQAASDVITVVGSQQTLSKAEADNLVQKTIGKQLPDGVEVSFIMSNGTIIPTFKKDGQPISAEDLKEPETELVKVNSSITAPITGLRKGENPEYDALVNPTKPALQGHLTSEQLEEFLASDTTYQGYSAKLEQIDSRMTEIETLYKMPRVREQSEFEVDDVSATLNIVGKPESNEYTKLGLGYKLLKRNLEEYKTVMQDWVDGPVGENSYYRINSMVFTNLERITLADGRRAWKTDQGTFLPASNGMPGGKKIEE